MTVKQFVEAIHQAWNADPFLSGTAIKHVKCRNGNFFVKLVDKTTVAVYLTEEGKIVFF